MRNDLETVGSEVPQLQEIRPQLASRHRNISRWGARVNFSYLRYLNDDH